MSSGEAGKGGANQEGQPGPLGTQTAVAGEAHRLLLSEKHGAPLSLQVPQGAPHTQTAPAGLPQSLVSLGEHGPKLSLQIPHGHNVVVVAVVVVVVVVEGVSEHVRQQMARMQLLFVSVRQACPAALHWLAHCVGC